MTYKNFAYLRDPLDYRNYMSTPSESQLWHDIRRAAADDKELQDILERAKIMYYLKHSSDNKGTTSLDW